MSRDPAGNATVLVVGPGDRAVQKTVQADRTISDKWLVTAGLAAGDRVIVEGLLRVKAGQRVVPVPAGSPPRRRGGGAQGGGAPAAGGARPSGA